MWMEIEKSKVLIKFLLNFRQSGDVLFFLNVRRLRGYTATPTIIKEWLIIQTIHSDSFESTHCNSKGGGLICWGDTEKYSERSENETPACLFFF